MDLGGGKLALAGVPSISGESRSYAVHLFAWNADLRAFEHIRSFGDLPPAHDREKIDYWGAGLVSRTRDGTLLFSRRVPYRIEEWREDGTFVRAIEGPVRLTVGPDEGILIEEGNGGISIR